MGNLTSRLFGVKHTLNPMDPTDYDMSYPLSADLFPSYTSSGTYIGNDSALSIVSVYACVRVLAETVASIPLFVYERLPSGGKDRDPEHPLYPVLHDQPNPDMTSFVWRELLVTHLTTWGNAYNEITYDRSGRLQLWPIRPDRMIVYYGSDGRRKYDYLQDNGQRREMKPGTVFHVSGLGANGLKGYSPISLHREAIGLYAAAEQFGSSFFRNNARPGIVLEHPKTASEDAIDRLSAQMDRLRGSGNSGKTVILEDGLTFKEIGIPPEDAQFIETRKFQMQEIARMFRVPPHMIGDLERATFSNIEHQSIDFVVHTIRPWLVRIEQEIKSQLMVGEDDAFPEFLVDGLLRGDAKARADALAIQRQNGVINGDEWREIENRNPIEDGSGQWYWMPVNYTSNEPAPEPEPEPEPEIPAPDPFAAVIEPEPEAVEATA